MIVFELEMKILPQRNRQRNMISSCLI